MDKGLGLAIEHSSITTGLSCDSDQLGMTSTLHCRALSWLNSESVTKTLTRSWFVSSFTLVPTKTGKSLTPLLREDSTILGRYG